MRHSNLAAAVVFGIGMFTAPTSAQQPPLSAPPPADKAMQETLSRRALAVLEATLKARGADGFRSNDPRLRFNPRFEFNGDVDHLRAPVDCAMPVIKGDPAVDPQFSKQPPTTPGKSFWSMKVIPVTPCPR
jgi:hypothetical protein